MGREGICIELFMTQLRAVCHPKGCSSGRPRDYIFQDAGRERLAAWDLLILGIEQ